MDMSQYYDLFISEAREHVKKIAELTVHLETVPADRPTVDALFRSAHSIKGMAASMGFGAITELAHKMEDLLDKVRHGLPVDSSLFDLLLSGSDHLLAMIADLENGGTGTTDNEDLIARIIAYPLHEETPPEQTVAPPGIASKAPTRKEETADNSQLESWSPPQTVRVRTDILDSFVNTTGELITIKHRLAILAGTVRGGSFSEALRDLGRHLRDLHDQVMAVRLMPLATITERYPRMVRDLAAKSGKEISFTMQGMEIELDRSILEVLGAPLTHILRNSIDHGIEPAAERLAAGKPARGSVTISVLRVKDQVEISIADDGRGMNPDQILAAAVSRGVVPREKAAGLSAHDKLMLICHPGFSTAARLTEISGRGVGMDVVKTTLQDLNGTLTITTEPGRGSCFLLKLPLTLAIINVLLVSVGQLTLAVPVTAITRTMELKRDELATIDDQNVFFLHGETIPLISLRHFLSMHADPEAAENVPLFIAEIKGRKTGILVDRLLGQQEVFVKPLARPLSSIAGLNGVTILGDGQIIFILDILNID